MERITNEEWRMGDLNPSGEAPYPSSLYLTPAVLIIIIIIIIIVIIIIVVVLIIIMNSYIYLKSY